LGMLVLSSGSATTCWVSFSTFPAFWDHICWLIHADLSYLINMPHSALSRHACLCTTMQTDTHSFMCTHLPRALCTRESRSRVGDTSQQNEWPRRIFLSMCEMTIIAGSIGIHTKFVWKLDENPASVGNKDTNCPNAKGLPLLLLFLSTKAPIRMRRLLLTTFTQH
jgi:hypothetical protein